MAKGSSFLPELPDTWEDTRATLHAYALAVGAIPRAHAEAHPKWWHVSFEVTGNGLVTEDVPLPGGGTLTLTMDLEADEVVMTTSAGDRHTFDMTAGLTGTELADALIATASRHGLDGGYVREKFENDDIRTYDSTAATTMLAIFANVNSVFESHRARIGGTVSPVQLWPHGFDIAFEWFGTRIETYEEDGEVTEYPSQLNLGFYPGAGAYFYSNPWPFEGEKLLDEDLPHGAEWHTEGWEGTILEYEKLAGDPDAERKLTEYAAAVYEIVAPTLSA